MPFGQKKAAVDTSTQAFSWPRVGFGGLQLGKVREEPETPQWSAEKLHIEVEAKGFESTESAFLAFLNGPAGSAWQAFVAAKHQDLQRGGSLPEEPASGPVQLCLGGKKAVQGWTIVNALELPGVDVVADIRNLEQWRDCSVDVVYMSHTLEHINYKSELQPCLRQVARILKPGGIFKCSVPDLAILCKMYLAELEWEDEFETKALAHYRKFPATWSSSGTLPASLSPAWTPEGAKVPIVTVTADESEGKIIAHKSAVTRIMIMRMIYGGQMDAFDFHKAGFDFAVLEAYLLAAGFTSVQRVDKIDEYGFDDTSSFKFYGNPISLNVVATK
jgi:predicted SAM-dependent methyltransferase